jgi:ribosomal protein S18 acetylase RimI-like enzyme
LLHLSKPLSIRRAEEHDNDFFSALYRDSRDDLRDAPIAEVLKEQLIQMQFLAHSQGIAQQYPQALFFVVTDKDQAVARLVISLDESELHLIDILVHSKARQRGIGSQIIGALQMYANLNSLRISLSVIRSNSAALHVYQKHGFVATEDDGFVLQMNYRPASTLVVS